MPTSVEPLERRRLFAAPLLSVTTAVSVPIGKTIQVPIAAEYDGAGGVSYSFKSSSKSIGLALHSSTFVQFDIAGYSDPMVFELFNDVAPNAVRRFTSLVSSGYYDGLTFHNVIKDFLIQSGDPTGTGTGGLTSTIDDEFDASTIFSGSGQLAMAQPTGAKDSAGSQFFITDGPQRSLDFNYTIFGQIVRGDDTRQAISNTAVDSSYKPLTPVTITDAKVIADTADTVLVVRALSADGGTIRVMASTADGNAVQSFAVQPFNDTVNDPPFMNAVPKTYYIAQNASLSATFSATDLPGNVIHWQGAQVQSTGLANAYIADNPDGTGLLTVTPTKDFTGVIKLIVGVGLAAATSRGNITQADSSEPLGGLYDTQLITVVVGQSPIVASGVALDYNSGIAASGYAVANFRDADSSKSASDFTASIDWGDGITSVGTVVAGSRAGTYLVLADKQYTATANGRIGVDVTITDSGSGQAVTAQSSAFVHDYASLAGGLLTIYGTSGNDRIGMSRKNQFYAVTVNGMTQAFAVSDVGSIAIYAQAGRDSVVMTSTVTAPAYIEGGDGNDTIYGGGGMDVINAGAGDDYVQCGDGGNRVAGGDGDDTLNGGAGRDRIFGGNGNDYIYGGPGRDILVGDAGNDTLLGGTSNDTLYGGDGDDLLNGMGGVDWVFGGRGTDTAKDDDLDSFSRDVEILN